MQQVAAKAHAPFVGVDEDHGHLPITRNDRTAAMLCATGFSQWHGQYLPARVGAANDQAPVGIGQLLPDPGTRSASVLLIGVAEAVTGNKET